MKTRALTEQIWVDEVEVDEEGIAEMLMDDTAIAQVASKFWLYHEFSRNRDAKVEIILRIITTVWAVPRAVL